MSGWIFAKGRAAEQTLDEVTAAGARSIALAGANAIFAPHERLLISEADGSETQWLGQVTQTTSAAVVFSRPVKLSKNTGARLWRAGSIFEIPAEAALPALRSTSPGVVTERSAGGQYFALQVAEPQVRLKLVIDDLTSKVEDGLLAWLAGQAQWGLAAFSIIDPLGAPAVVRLTGEPLEQTRTAQDRRVLALHLTIVEEGAYQ